jgi:uncharacterized protein (TIGR03437 family)
MASTECRCVAFKFPVVFVLLAGVAVSSAQTYTPLLDFDGSNGSEPAKMPLVQGTGGLLYGTTSAGGINGYGAIFDITLSGAQTTLQRFDSVNGSSPEGGLVQGADGNFYGTTKTGGSNNTCQSGCGTIFTISPTGALTTLASFNSIFGSSPVGGLIQGSDGNFYGTASEGGGFTTCTSGCGTIFRVTPTGTLTVLQSFDSSDGSSPQGRLVLGSDGNFYGTTSTGGTSNSCQSGCGTIFKVTPTGSLTTLYSFHSTDGSSPQGGLVQGADGNFYGTTSSGGTSNACTSGCGTVFTITPQGTLTTLHTFNSIGGSSPQGSLVLGSDGNFYGTTSSGGTSNGCTSGCGTIFRITAQGTLTTLYNFNGAEGSAPQAGLIQANDGNFYGATNTGGVNGDGVIYRLSVGSQPAPSINSGGILNAASYAASVAPGSIAVVYGSFLLSSTSAAGVLPLPESLSGLSMQFTGGSQAPLFYASGGQVNIQVPWELAGQTQLTVSSSGQTSAPQDLTLATFAPGIFSANAQGTGQGAILDSSYSLVDASNPATAGTTYILIYCTGLGPVSNPPASGSPATSSPPSETTTTPTVTIGNVPAQIVSFSGLAPGYVGLYQVNAQVPAGAPSGTAVPVVVSIGGTTSNAVTIAVGP